MKRTIVKIGKTGKIITAILGFITTLFACWGIYKSYSTKDISGKWRLTFKVEKCNHKVYIGDTHTQLTVFNQSDQNIVGKGEKWDYNGQPLPFTQHRKLEYTGTIDRNTLKAIYVLHGLKRDSEGSITAVISEDGKTLSGTYSGTIGNDSGPITGEKVD